VQRKTSIIGLFPQTLRTLIDEVPRSVDAVLVSLVSLTCRSMVQRNPPVVVLLQKGWLPRVPHDPDDFHRPAPGSLVQGKPPAMVPFLRAAGRGSHASARTRTAPTGAPQASYSTYIKLATVSIYRHNLSDRRRKRRALLCMNKIESVARITSSRELKGLAPALFARSSLQSSVHPALIMMFRFGFHGLKSVTACIAFIQLMFTAQM
jgi:hypothetical protein